jgi:hypothetical protein
MLDVKINRRGWLKGEGSDASKLLRESDGLRCCIGFAASAAGFGDHTLWDKCTLEEFWAGPGGFRGTGFASLDDLYDPTIYHELYETNDDRDIPDDMREEKVALLGRQVGIKFTFVD